MAPVSTEYTCLAKNGRDVSMIRVIGSPGGSCRVPPIAISIGGWTSAR